MDRERKPIRLQVVFEADDDYELVDAISTFMEEVIAKGSAKGGAGRTKDGWRYKTESPGA